MREKKIQNKHLPIMGIGPLYVVVIITLTVVGIALSIMNRIPFIGIPKLEILFRILGIISILLGVILYLKAVFFDKIDTYVKKNQLIITGVYAYVRNPIYSAFMFVCTGILCIYANLILLFLPFVYWAFMTMLMKYTEEKWLYDLYGEEYIHYCRRVNRCIPWKK
ncbi:methyltransferase family protein [Bulleidia extructa]|uniref:methyltransferase family protein n=1 Tax=Bulleidia extructa TaxID=118748 RepID=UPI003BF0F149